MTTRKLPIVVIAVLIGFLTAAQVAANAKLSNKAITEDSRAIAVETAELIKNIDKLETEKLSLDNERSKLTSASTESQDALQKEIDRLKIVGGKTEVTGEGVEITFDKPLLISDIIDLLNALRNIGAEGISLNDNRVVPGVGFSLDGLKAQTTVRAIGKQELLEQAITRRGGILEELDQGKVSKKSELTLPAVP